MSSPQFAQQTIAITNGRLILPHSVVKDRALLLKDGKILGFSALEQVGAEFERVDAGKRYVAPGLIDIHTHGALGHSFNEPDKAAWEIITAENLRHGITSLLATLGAAPLKDLLSCLALAREWKKKPHAGSQILGVHSEGPFLSMDQKGAQDPRGIQPLEREAVEKLLAYSDVLTMMTYAPEISGALDFTDRLHELGIIAAAGHSSAYDSDLLAAYEHGLRHTVHIWSSQSSVIREGPWRKPGLLEATLTMDGITAEMISDNRHLPPTLMKLAYRCKGADRLCVVSDASSAAGFPDGTRFDFDGLECEVTNGVAMLIDQTAFAGSTTLLNQMIPILTDVVNIPLVEAVRMASLTPARIIHVDRTKGSLETGKDADLVIFEPDFRAWRVMVGGQWVMPSSASIS
jgi:N-acetylglucosamine-6-phosphate deacetylase